MEVIPGSADYTLEFLLDFPFLMTTPVTKYVRYAFAGKNSYGILDGSSIRELNGNFLHDATPTGNVVPLAEAKLLAPCEPSKVIAVGRNFKSHLGERAPSAYPTVFLKLPSCIIGPDEAIVIPPGATDVHYEAELVVVMGKPASKISKEDVASHIFGVTAGNDISERVWQKNDVQWFRAKASDTFGPLGPAIVQGLQYNDLLIESRVNGEVRQSQRTCDMLFDIPTMVSYISQFITLFTGDVIYTGTPAKTRAMQPGDVVEVEIEGIGILRNPVR
jgi:2-keto-4-pentenoate hydratase/2-oxohepta-3-ene-1,7-dioic acid hydratase in catechol pathway